ncbi:MAG TPA: hypothetical protein VKB84_06480 [Candidatus Binataceae bacterium]|jgi:hypothetical protein|nr:hypothetical protein [Candidatus Binataceae bacterium]
MSGDIFDERFPDNFYRGVIINLNRATLKGKVRSDSGREIPFQFPHVAVVGAAIGGLAPGMEMLRVGDHIGFDVGWSSKGLAVTKIKPL